MARKWNHPDLGPGFGAQCSKPPKSNSKFCGRHAAKIKNPTRCKECSQKNTHPIVHQYTWECRGQVIDKIPTYFKCTECKHKLRNCVCDKDEPDLTNLDSFSKENILLAMEGEGDDKLIEQVSQLLMDGQDETLESYLSKRNHVPKISKQVTITPYPNVSSLIGIIIDGRVLCTDMKNNLFAFYEGEYQYQGKYSYPD